MGPKGASPPPGPILQEDPGQASPVGRPELLVVDLPQPEVEDGTSRLLPDLPADRSAGGLASPAPAPGSDPPLSGVTAHRRTDEEDPSPPVLHPAGHSKGRSIEDPTGGAVEGHLRYVTLPGDPDGTVLPAPFRSGECAGPPENLLPHPTPVPSRGRWWERRRLG